MGAPGASSRWPNPRRFSETSFREHIMPKARFPRTSDTGSQVSEKASSRTFVNKGKKKARAVRPQPPHPLLRSYSKPDSRAESGLVDELLACGLKSGRFLPKAHERTPGRHSSLASPASNPRPCLL